MLSYGPGMARATQEERGRRFAALHEGPCFVIPNPWDGGTARVLESLGFEALATTSSAFAFTLGRDDGEVTLDELVEHVGALSAATDLPISVDLENGFGAAPEHAARAIEAVAAVGAVGGSIEDWDAEAGIYEFGAAAERIAAAAEAARALPFDFTLTARAENHIRGNPDLDDTIARLRAYEEAGADVLYAPGLADARRSPRSSRRSASRSTCSPGRTLTSARSPPPGRGGSASAARSPGRRSRRWRRSPSGCWTRATSPDCAAAPRWKVARGGRRRVSDAAPRPEPEVVDDKEQSRYEVHLGGATVAIADYVKQPGIVSFTHTETFAGHKGQGHAARMIERALRDARDEGLEVMPFCSYVAAYIKEHDEFADLVPAERRAGFGLDG